MKNLQERHPKGTTLNMWALPQHGFKWYKSSALYDFYVNSKTREYAKRHKDTGFTEFAKDKE